MIINCVNCGKRYSNEFSYEGDASIKRPSLSEYDNQQAWYDYVYARNHFASAVFVVVRFALV